MKTILTQRWWGARGTELEFRVLIYFFVFCSIKTGLCRVLFFSFVVFSPNVVFSRCL